MTPNHKGLDLIAGTFAPLVKITFHCSYGVVGLDIASKISATEIHEMLNIALDQSDSSLHSMLHVYAEYNMSMHGEKDYWKKSAEQALLTGCVVGLEFLKGKSEVFEMEFVKKLPNLIFSYALAVDVLCIHRVDKSRDSAMICLKPVSRIDSVKKIFKL